MAARKSISTQCPFAAVGHRVSEGPSGNLARRVFAALSCLFVMFLAPYDDSRDQILSRKIDALGMHDNGGAFFVRSSKPKSDDNYKWYGGLSSGGPDTTWFSGDASGALDFHYGSCRAVADPIAGGPITYCNSEKTSPFLPAMEPAMALLVLGSFAATGLLARFVTPPRTFRGNRVSGLLSWAAGPVREPWYGDVSELRERMAEEGHSRLFIETNTIVQLFLLVLHVAKGLVLDALEGVLHTARGR